MTTPEAIQFNAENAELICSGDWTLIQFSHLKTALTGIRPKNNHNLTVNGAAIEHMDSAGAWLLNQWIEGLEQQKISVELSQFSKPHLQLINLIADDLAQETKSEIPAPQHLNLIARIGKNTIAMLTEWLLYLAFIGQLTIEALRILASPRHFRIKALANVLYRNGYQALPIIALLSFMIGVVITYQMGLQLRSYGANIYIVDLLGLSILREFGPLLTAIMVAGRTGSSFTAQLGIMKINQEIDALDTIGVTPGELLLLPRIIGLIIALPLLTVWANMFGVLGGMTMSNSMLDITWYDFLERFPHVIPLRALLIGLIKTPVFAFIIATVGCFEGMRVEGSADSVGRNTTRSVVLSIFFIIVADAIFSIIFSKLKL